MGVVKKGAVTIDHCIGSLVENVGDSACVKCGSEFSAARILNAMHRPQNLFDAVENDALARFFAWVICGKTAVIRWVPVFCGNNQVETPLQFISDWNDFIAMRHGQRAAGQKIILKIDNDERIHWLCLAYEDVA